MYIILELENLGVITELQKIQQQTTNLSPAMAAIGQLGMRGITWCEMGEIPTG
jgi:hypothetical protein